MIRRLPIMQISLSFGKKYIKYTYQEVILITFACVMSNNRNITDLSVAMIMTETAPAHRSDNFAHGSFGIMMNHLWADAPILQISSPYRLKGARIVRVLEGSIRYRVNLLDYSVSSGEIIWIPDSTLLEVIGVSYDYRFQALAFDDRSHRRDNAKVFKLSENQSTQLSKLASFIRQVSDNQPFPETVIENLLSAYIGILEQTSASIAAASPLPSRREQVFTRFVSLVSQHFREHRETAFYADQLCLASHYLSSLIKEASGESPSVWITRAVISEAKVHLKQSEKTILQISEELGFPNAPFFCRYFKRETGMTPSEYRHSD